MRKKIHSEQNNKFMILGAHSRLGRAFYNAYPDKCVALNKKDCDITDKETLESMLKKYPYKYVLNCAALTDITYCEQNPTECFDTNTIAVASLNELCIKHNKKLIHLSSDYAVNPVNIYGYSKYLSEKLVSPNMLTIRTNFYDTETYIIQKVMTGETVTAYTNVLTNPISIKRLVKEIYKNKNRKGLINIFSDKKISWYQFAEMLCILIEKDKQLLNPSIYTNQPNQPTRPLSSYIKPDIKIDIREDLNNQVILERNEVKR